jgi:hypothetical protein
MCIRDRSKLLAAQFEEKFEEMFEETFEEMFEEKVFAEDRSCYICGDESPGCETDTMCKNFSCRFVTHDACVEAWFRGAGKCPKCSTGLSDMVPQVKQKVEKCGLDHESGLYLDCMQNAYEGKGDFCYCRRPLYQLGIPEQNSYCSLLLCLGKKCKSKNATKHIKMAMEEWLWYEFGDRMPDDMWKITFSYLFEGTMENARHWIGRIPINLKQEKPPSTKVKKVRRGVDVGNGIIKWINIPEYDGYRRLTKEGAKTRIVKRI